jgi:integrase
VDTGSQSLVLNRGPHALDYAIRAWLDAKAKRTGSARTGEAYIAVLTSFRAYLLDRGFDLDSTPQIVADAAQAWADRAPVVQRQVSANTYNQRLAVLSSFYTFARRRGHLDVANPIDLLERRKVQPYAGARALDAQTVQQRLALIDRGTLDGKRDYALLMVALTTGRRRAELAGLRWQDVEISGTPGQVSLALHFRGKGGKPFHDKLPPATRDALLDYLVAAYGTLDGLPETTPVWLAFTPRLIGTRTPLGHQGIAAVYLKWLGSSKVHVTRHTFAHWMEEAGARVSEIQQRLGHASLSTTSIYLATVRPAENAYGEQLEGMLGARPKS